MKDRGVCMTSINKLWIHQQCCGKFENVHGKHPGVWQLASNELAPASRSFQFWTKELLSLATANSHQKEAWMPWGESQALLAGQLVLGKTLKINSFYLVLYLVSPREPKRDSKHDLQPLSDLTVVKNNSSRTQHYKLLFMPPACFTCASPVAWSKPCLKYCNIVL